MCACFGSASRAVVCGGRYFGKVYRYPGRHLPLQGLEFGWPGPVPPRHLALLGKLGLHGPFNAIECNSDGIQQHTKKKQTFGCSTRTAKSGSSSFQMGQVLVPFNFGFQIDKLTDEEEAVDAMYRAIEDIMSNDWSSMEWGEREYYYMKWGERDILSSGASATIGGGRARLL